ncbi:MAG: transcriptional repressor NrdR [Planctomycetes bacterium]|nr:transcriptional repressor NrdR [Planctomycetota bacterium]
MRCPYCRTDNDRVIDTRASEDGFAVRRRRMCNSCKRRYTTYERLEEVSLRVVKKDGVREPFQPEKIRHGLTKACWKRPIREEDIEDVVAAVEREVYANFDAEIHSRDLGELVMENLAEVDQVAYVRFASVYREFQDAQDFVEELQPILDRRPREEPTASPEGV